MPVHEDQYKQPALQAPTPLAIPQGKFIDIDQKYYLPAELAPSVEDIHSRGRTLRPRKHDEAATGGFVEPSTPIGLSTGSIVVNYGSYLFQKRTGSDANHMPPPSTQGVVFA
jgi:hypothetical protein